MSLTKAVSASNAPKGDGDQSKTSGSLGMVGFTPVDYPSQSPAKSNSDIANTNDAAKDSMGNDGTNMSAYDEQKADISGETGK